MTGPAPDARRIYLGWQYALVHPDPGPPPPPPVPPGPEQVNPGWLAAQRREERRLSRPLKCLGGARRRWPGCCSRSGCRAAEPLADRAGPAVCLAGRRCQRARLSAWPAGPARAGRREEQRVARVRAVAAAPAAQLQQEQHARRSATWQAAREAFDRQLTGMRCRCPRDRPGGRGRRHAGRLVGAADHARRAAAGRGRRGHRARPGRGRGGPGPAGDGARLRHRPAGLGPARRPAPAGAGPGPAPTLWPTCWPWPRRQAGPGHPAGPVRAGQDTAILERVATILGDQPSPGELRPACACWPRPVTSGRTSGRA